MTTTVGRLAELVQGQVHGDAALPISAARVLDEAEEGHVTFLEDERQAKRLAASRASAVLVPLGLTTEGRTLIRVKDPLAAFIQIVQHLHGAPTAHPPGIDPRACVHPTAQIGPDAVIHAFAWVGEGAVIGARCQLYPGAVVGRRCTLGDDVILYPQAVLYDGTVLGHRAIIHAHAVLGADGFGYRQQQGKHVKVPQLGHVEIGDDVEVGACTTIDRGTFQATRIGTGTKIDNLVMVGHNCQVGPHNILVSQVGIAGSCTTGAYVVMAGQVGVADHVHIGAGAVIGAQSGVGSDLEGGQRYFGAPAMPDREQKRILLTTLKLPEIRQDLLRIKKHLGLEQGREAC